MIVICETMHINKGTSICIALLKAEITKCVMGRKKENSKKQAGLGVIPTK